MASEITETANVLDFGIAKFLPVATVQPTVDTAPGAVLGTFRYMSSEQWRGEEAHPVWDLWALVAVVYEMLTGANPFDGRPPAEWFGTGAVTKFTPVSVHLPEAHRSWQEFFKHVFAHEVARRPRSAETCQNCGEP